MTKAYRNLVPGDQGTEVIPAVLIGAERTQLAEKTRINNEMALLEADLRNLQSQLKALQENCQHHVFTDAAGFPYDVRHCHLCGKYMGQL